MTSVSILSYDVVLYSWNLVLDINGGPNWYEFIFDMTASAHVSKVSSELTIMNMFCFVLFFVSRAKNFVDAPILVDPSDPSHFYKQPMWYALTHISRYVVPGSKRLEFKAAASLFHDLEFGCFQTPDNHLVMYVSIVFMNVSYLHICSNSRYSLSQCCVESTYVFRRFV